MSLFDNPDQLLLLRDLLNPNNRNRDDSDFDDDEEESLVNKQITPGTIGAQTATQEKAKKAFNQNSPYAPLKEDAKEKEKQPASLEEWQQQHEEEDKAILDSRKSPAYNMTYRQAVGTEDVFLQMGNRTDATASCEDLILEILLPDDDTPTDKMQLTMTESEVELSTPIHHLKLPLMHKINVDRCQATYTPNEYKLTLILRLQRELDFVNF